MPQSRTGCRILLGQLYSNGDCLYATAIARQIKEDFPGCHLTWAISSMCRKIIAGNPYVDEVWEVPMSSLSEAFGTSVFLETAAYERLKAGDFDHVFMTALSPLHLDRYDGTIRSSMFNAYPRPITVPISPVLRLSIEEKRRVEEFATVHQLSRRSAVILVESSPKTRQSFMNPDLAMRFAELITRELTQSCVLISADTSLKTTNNQIIDASVLSLRENAELSHYCSLLVGCSSGITWICTSDSAKSLPTVQLVDPNADFANPMFRDHARWGLPTEQILQMKTCTVDKLVECVRTVLEEGMPSAKRRFHETIKERLQTYLDIEAELRRNDGRKRSRQFLIKSIRSHPALFLLYSRQVLCNGYRRVKSSLKRRFKKFLGAR